MKILRQGFSKATVSGTRSGSHRTLYRHFEVMKSIWRGSPNVEPVPFSIDCILEDNNNVNALHNDEGESGVNDNDNNATISLLAHTTNDSDSNDNENEMENPDAANSSIS